LHEAIPQVLEGQYRKSLLSHWCDGAASNCKNFQVRWYSGGDRRRMTNYTESGINSRSQDGSARNDGDELDNAGEAILRLLRKAADAAEANSRRASEAEQELSSQLEAAKGRIAELEAHIQFYRDKAEHAEEWLRKIAAEIEDRLIREPEDMRRKTSGRL
jgi:chromosome segregation ATPase